MSQGNHFIWAIIAGVVIMINGGIQATGNNTALAVASILIGAGAIAFGIIKPGGHDRFGREDDFLWPDRQTRSTQEARKMQDVLRNLAAIGLSCNNIRAELLSLVFGGT